MPVTFTVSKPAATITKNAFLLAYRARLAAQGYAWTSDPTKLERFIAGAAATISGLQNGWIAEGPAARGAWQDIGAKGRMSLKRLRALPPGDARGAIEILEDAGALRQTGD